MIAEPTPLQLDDRQRAMLREMGVQVWQPRTNPPPPLEAAAPGPAVVRLAAPSPEPAAPAPAPAPAVTVAPAPAAPAAAAVATTAPAAVLRGEWQALFASGTTEPEGPVWLVLSDGPTPDPTAGDAGKLLLAMLRAAGLHKGARVWGASVGRAGEPGVPLADALAQALQAHRPAMVLTLGRLAAQAATGRAEPLGRLRGEVHDVTGFAMVASYEPAYLLRAQDDKARAWEDLCRALAHLRRP